MLGRCVCLLCLSRLLVTAGLDMRPVYTAALSLYFVYAVCHQAYTLYYEHSWQHRRGLEVSMSVISHQVINFSYIYAYYSCYTPESLPYLVCKSTGYPFRRLIDPSTQAICRCL